MLKTKTKQNRNNEKPRVLKNIKLGLYSSSSRATVTIPSEVPESNKSGKGLGVSPSQEEGWEGIP